MTLENWLKNGWVQAHETSSQEIQDLLAVADRDLVDCQVQGLGDDWRLNIAYNAALQLATVALAAQGFRASRDNHHYRVIQSLAYTIHLDPALIRQFDLFRKKRNQGGYERAGVASSQEATEMLKLAQQLRRLVKDWLAANHPELL